MVHLSHNMKSPNGFTLVEMMMVIFLSTLCALALGWMMQYFYRSNAYALEQIDALESARRSVQSMTRDLREASYGDDGSYPVLTAATSTVSFFADTDNDQAVEKIRYYLSGTNLYRGVTQSAGSPPSYTGQPESNDIVVANVRNGTSTSIFVYEDENGSALSSPVNVSLVRSINFTVLADVNPLRAPVVYTLIGSATIRNLYLTQ
jgi:prepilin-type N-terminal cleavage/methylation domain-containing protein